MNRKKAFFALVVLLVVFGLWAYRPPRPLFHNVYASRDGLFFRDWQFHGPISDNANSIAFVDIHLNQLAVFLSRSVDKRLEAVSVVEFSPQFAKFRVGDGPICKVQAEENVVVFFLEDGSSAKTSISANSAKKIFSLMSPSQPILDSISQSQLENKDDLIRTINSLRGA